MVQRASAAASVGRMFEGYTDKREFWWTTAKSSQVCGAEVCGKAVLLFVPLRFLYTIQWMFLRPTTRPRRFNHQSPNASLGKTFLEVSWTEFRTTFQKKKKTLRPPAEGRLKVREGKLPVEGKLSRKRKRAHLFLHLYQQRRAHLSLLRLAKLLPQVEGRPGTTQITMERKRKK